MDSKESLEKQLEKENEVEVKKTGERTIISKPQTYYAGGCKHFYVETFIDDEGIMNAQCTKCPMGVRFREEEMELKDGRLTKR
jgi:hypothetical protein